jgi:hypothetical protein
MHIHRLAGGAFGFDELHLRFEPLEARCRRRIVNGLPALRCEVIGILCLAQVKYRLSAGRRLGNTAAEVEAIIDFRPVGWLARGPGYPGVERGDREYGQEYKEDRPVAAQESAHGT